eukprot:5772119-Pleurochrysis_carterae.AAC.1
MATAVGCSARRLLEVASDPDAFLACCEQQLRQRVVHEQRIHASRLNFVRLHHSTDYHPLHRFVALPFFGLLDAWIIDTIL